MQIFVTRHGKTEWNVLKKDIDQARKTKEKLKDIGFNTNMLS